MACVDPAKFQHDQHGHPSSLISLLVHKANNNFSIGHLAHTELADLNLASGGFAV